MKIKIFYFSLVLSISFGLQASELPKNIRKKVSKEITSSFKVDGFELKDLIVSDDINEKLKHPIKPNNFFEIIVNNESIGYAYISKAPSKTDEFDYMVLFDKELIIVSSKLLIYREDYGAEIGSKRWLKQFIGLTEDSEIEYGNQIIPISGATISAESMTVAINNLLASISILNKIGVFK